MTVSAIPMLDRPADPACGTPWPASCAWIESMYLDAGKPVSPVPFQEGEMQIYENVAGLMRALGNAVVVSDDGSSVTVNDRGAVRGDLMDALAWNAAFGQNGVKRQLSG